MANTRAKNVILVDTTGFNPADNMTICAIKYIGASTSSVTIKDETSSGMVLWEESASTNVYNDNLEIRATKGIHVAISGTAKVYLYLK